MGYGLGWGDPTIGSGMNRSEIRANMRLLLNEDKPGFWKDEDLNKCINMACQKVNSIISGIKEDYFTISAVFQTVAETKSYNLPLDCRFVRRMEVYDPADTHKIYKIDEIKFPQTEGNGPWPFVYSGRPMGYQVIGKRFDLLPIPDMTYDMRIYYDGRKNDLAIDTDSPYIPADFCDAIVFWGCVLAATINGGPQEDADIQRYTAMFSQRKEELIQSLLRRGSDDTKAVVGFLEGII